MSQAVKDSICHTIWFNTVMYKVMMYLHKVHIPPPIFSLCSIFFLKYLYWYQWSYIRHKVLLNTGLSEVPAIFQTYI